MDKIGWRYVLWDSIPLGSRIALVTIAIVGLATITAMLVVALA